MEYLQEGFALGVDLVILGLCVREYMSCKRNANLLKATPQLSIDNKLKDYVRQQQDNKLPYVAIRGTVAPIGIPMRSIMSPSVTGVLQIIKLNEHRVARGIAGFWSEQRKLIHLSTNGMPFELRNNNVGVEISDALSAAVLDLDVVYDNYEPTSLSFVDHVFGFFSGIRQKGFQTTEEILRDGSYITAIGELELDNNTLRLQPSASGPLFLTTSTKANLVKKFEDAKYSMMLKIFVCGTISAVLIGIILRKLYLKKKEKYDERCRRLLREKQRKQRRARSRPTNLTPEQMCVVCSANPKEVVFLPCGHVCICEDCSDNIQNNCPMCRTKIDTRAAAYIS